MIPPVTNEEIAALRTFEGALAFRYRALLNRALDELQERRLPQHPVCACSRADRQWKDTPGKCMACGGHSDMLTDGELDEIARVAPSLKMTALIAEVRLRRATDRGDTK